MNAQAIVANKEVATQSNVHNEHTQSEECDFNKGFEEKGNEACVSTDFSLSSHEIEDEDFNDESFNDTVEDKSFVDEEEFSVADSNIEDSAVTSDESADYIETIGAPMLDIIGEEEPDAPTYLHCPACKVVVSPDASFCHVCGANLANLNRAAAKTAKSKRYRKHCWQFWRAKEPKPEDEPLRLYGEHCAHASNDIVGFKYLHENGIAETPDGRFSRTFEFSDISYVNERQDVQDDIFVTLCQLHASFPPKSIYQINLVNFPSFDDGSSRILPEIGPDADLARAFNEITAKRQREGRTDITRKNYFSYSLAEETYADAESQLAAIRSAVEQRFSELKSRLHELDGVERAELMHNLIRGSEEPFLLDYGKLKKTKKKHVRDFLAPSWVVYPPENQNVYMKSYMRMPAHFVKTFHIRDFGSDLSDAAIRSIRALPVPMNISLLFAPQEKSKAVTRIKRNIDTVQAEIFNYQRQVSKGGGDVTMLPPALESKEAGGRELLDFVTEEDQQVGFFQGLITIYAPTLEKLATYERLVKGEASSWSVDIVSLPTLQEQAFTSAMPLATSILEGRYRSLTSAEGAIMEPFASQNLSDDPAKSYLLGQSRVTNQNIFVSPTACTSPHMWVFGMTGAGKGMFMNQLLTYTQLQHPRLGVEEKTGCAISRDKDMPQIFIADFHGEYVALGEKLGWSVNSFGPGHEGCLNPMALASEQGQVTRRILGKNLDHFLALTQSVMGRAYTPQERTMIDKCAGLAYEKHLSTNTRPTMGDFYQCLREQHTQVADDLADGFEVFTEGTMDALNGQTNVHDNRDGNVYDFSELGKTMETITMLSFLQHVRQKTFENYAKGIPTMLVLEEVQILFDNDAAVKLLMDMFAEMRKYNLRIIAITQLPDRVLNHPKAQYLFKNSGLFVLLAQTEEVQDICADTFRLSKTQRDALSQTSEKGSGLVIADGVKVAMRNLVPKNNILYDIWNTDPDKYAREKQARRAA